MVSRFLKTLAIAALAFSCSALCGTSEAAAKPKVHVVYSGQRLGSIAKRYNITVDQLCQANGITRNAKIKPGQKLIIPGTDDGTGSSNQAGKSDKSEKSNKSTKESAKPAKPEGKIRFHTVAKGHTLSAIAGRYAITVGSLCNANGLARNASLTVGDQLVIPHKTDKNGEYAKQQRARGHTQEAAEESRDDDSARKGKGEQTWKKYEKPAWRRGFIKIARYGRSWEGYVIGPKGEVLGLASNKINFVMGAREDGPQIDGKLIRLIASISDNFGGREMRIVSGYRTKSFVAASKHKQGKALDFSIPGIPNDVLRDYLRTIDGVGVGYYPNSSFVHLDVRGYNSYWVDHAGPGEAPRKGTKSKGSKKGPSSGKSKPAPEEPSEPDDDDSHNHSHGDDGASEDAPPEDAPSGDSTDAEDAPGADAED
jgi:LysM repeat protein